MAFRILAFDSNGIEKNLNYIWRNVFTFFFFKSKCEFGIGNKFLYKLHLIRMLQVSCADPSLRCINNRLRTTSWHWKPRPCRSPDLFISTLQQHTFPSLFLLTHPVYMLLRTNVFFTNLCSSGPSYLYDVYMWRGKIAPLKVLW